MERFKRANFGYGFLAANITAGASTVTLNSGHQLPTTTGNFRAIIWNSLSYPNPSTDPGLEIVTGAYSGTLNVYNLIRAQESTTASAHLSGAKIAMTYTAGVSEADMWYVGTAEVDETNKANSRILQYVSSTNKLVYVAVPGGGNMLQSVYDPNTDGIIENAQLGSLSAAKLTSGIIPTDRSMTCREVASDGSVTRFCVASGGASYTAPTVKVIANRSNSIAPNADFEYWTTTPGAPNYWTFSQTGTGGSVAKETVQIHNNINSAKLTKSTGVVYLFQTYTTLAYNGKYVTASCWVKSANTATNAIIFQLNDNLATGLSLGQSYYQNSGGWELLTATIKVSDNSSNLTCYMYMTSAATAVAYFDDVIVAPYRPATATVVVAAGVITSLMITDPGQGYYVDMNSEYANPYPTAAITDSTGSGAVIIPYVRTGLPGYKNTGYDSSFYIMRDGTLKACGYNTQGKLGHGQYDTQSYVPVSSVFADSISPGYDLIPPDPVYVEECYMSAYCLCSDGTLWSVGRNAAYVLGLNDVTQRDVFSLINQAWLGSKPVVKVKCSTDNGTSYQGVWAWNSDGKLYRWGYNGYGQLGNGGAANIAYPQELTLAGEVPIDVTFGGGASTITTYILCASGNVYVAGYNGHGGCSDGTTTQVNTFKKIQTGPGTYLTGVKSISGADGSTYTVIYFLKTDGTVWAAGYNAQGELGNNNTTSTGAGYVNQVQNSPSTYLTDIYKIYSYASAGGSTCCGYAEHYDGNFYCWGYNAQGQLGVGDVTQRLYAVLSTTLNAIRSGYRIVKVRMGKGPDNESITVQTGTNRLYSVGKNDSYGNLGIGHALNMSTFTYSMLQRRDIVDFRYAHDTSGANYGLQVLCADGSAYTCGYNGQGQLGNGSTYYRQTLGSVVF